MPQFDDLKRSLFKGGELFHMKNPRPIIGITMGDPAGIGPEIILKALDTPNLYAACRPLVLGDRTILESAKKSTGSILRINCVTSTSMGKYTPGVLDLLCLSDLSPSWGHPCPETGRAMITYINQAVEMASGKEIAGMVTCPINKTAMKMAGSPFSGHTELIAHQTGTNEFAMMMAGDKLRVVLVTIHIPLAAVPAALSKKKISKTIDLTCDALVHRFGIPHPKIAIAGLNPHAGEEGLFGDEEVRLIMPAMETGRDKGFDLIGPLPPDTVFVKAVEENYDAVICMYHDQGLIPFKMIHFSDGVNTTIGLPIIRTSVDHGTAYDIAGSGHADPGSLIAAVKMAALQAGVMCQSLK